MTNKTYQLTNLLTFMKISLIKPIFVLCSLFFALNISAQNTQKQLALTSTQNIELKTNQLMQGVENQDIVNILNEIGSTVSEIQSKLAMYADQIDLSNIVAALQDNETGFNNINTPTTQGLGNLATSLRSVNNDLTNLINAGGVVPCDYCGINNGNNSDPNKSKNYIRTKTYTSTFQFIEQIQYFDGLGRPNEAVQKGITPDRKDLISIVEYDGEKQRQYLPATVNNQSSGNFVDLQSVINAAKAMYNNDSRPYVETKSEKRTVTVTGAGEYYQNNPAKQKTELNAANEVKKFRIKDSKLTADGYYPANTLYKTVSTDEDGKTAAKFTNKLGRVVMTTQGTDNQTCYVYDDFGLLSFVLPPLAVDEISSGTVEDDDPVLKKYAYLYKYDELGREIYKKLPGCEPIFMVYDKADRLIFSQDGNQRAGNGASKKWTYFRYDVYGRLLYSGICKTQLSHATLQENFKDIIATENAEGVAYAPATDEDNEPQTNSSGIGYTQTEYTGIIYDEFLSVNYYDSYSFLNLHIFAQIKADLTYQEKQGYDVADKKTIINGFSSFNAIGLQTGSVAYILDNSGNFLTTAIYYDAKGQAVQTRSTNHLNGYDIVYNKYNFTGTVAQTLKEHSINPPAGDVGGNPSPSLPAGEGVNSEKYWYAYDHAGRLTNTNYVLDNNPSVLVSVNTFDNLGRVTQKKRWINYNQPDIETFEYNIKSQITKIKSGIFQEILSYEGLYNGNISSTTSQNLTFNYKYDELNRLTEGKSTNNVKFDETFTYDKHGNIKTLVRLNGTPVDNLNLSYEGNQLVKVEDSAVSLSKNMSLYYTKQYNQKDDGTFEYDANGNLTFDSDRKILSIQYNVLNLPSKIEFEGGNFIENVYAADGRKLSSYYKTEITPVMEPMERTLIGVMTLSKNNIETEIESGTHYVGNFEYLLGQDGAVESTRIHNAEGYVENSEYYYFRKDHIGNNREVWNATTGATVQKTDYYPSGLPLNTGGTLGADVQPYKHTGKEFIEMGGYDVYDLGFRTYYPAIGRFTTIDPLAESTYSQSPYVYAANNPVRYIDFLGLAATDPPPTGLEHEGDNISIYDYNGFVDGSSNFMNGCGFPPYGGFRDPWETFGDLLHGFSRNEWIQMWHNVYKNGDISQATFVGMVSYANTFGGSGFFGTNTGGFGGYHGPEYNFRTKFGAWVYKVFHGGGTIGKDTDTGEWFVSKKEKVNTNTSSGSKEVVGEDGQKTTELPNVTTVATRIFDNKGRTTPIDWKLRDAANSWYDAYKIREFWKSNGAWVETDSRFDMIMGTLQIGLSVVLPSIGYNMVNTARAATTTTTVQIETSVSKLMGNSYVAMGEIVTPIKNTELLNSLNATSKGNWVKVYEAGIQNGTKIEVHYFRNTTTRQVFDVKTKYNYWHQSAFQNIGR